MASDLIGMIHQRDALDKQIQQARDEILSGYVDALDAIMRELEDWADAEAHSLSRDQRKHAETVTVNGAVHVVFGYPCESCRERLEIEWGGGSHADFGGLLPPPAAVIAFIAALLAETTETTGETR